MSKKPDMLGSIVRALVGVERSHHGVILDIVNKLGGKDAEYVRERLASALRQKGYRKFRVIDGEEWYSDETRPVREKTPRSKSNDSFDDNFLYQVRGIG